MTGYAVGRHILPSLLLRPNQNVQHSVGSSIGDLLNLQMHKLGNILQLVVRHRRKRRHTLLRQSLLQKRDQMLAMIVAEHLVRRDQADPRRSTRFLSMAECTTLLVERLSARGRRFVRLRAQTQKCARGGSPLFWSHILIAYM